MSEDIHNTELEASIFTVFKIAVVSTAIIFFTYFWFFPGGLSSDHQRWSEFGSFIGGTVGSLVSFFAFFALLLTLILQNKAIRISKEELALTRKELEKTSNSAESQAKHFINEAKITDIVESIKEIERTIKTKAGYTIPVFDDRITQPSPAPLEKFLYREMDLISHWSSASRDQVNDENLRPEEIGDLFKLLFDQLMLLRDIPEASNRYKVLMHKHLETFFLLSQVGALPFDWTSPLDKESKSWLKIYKETFRGYEIRNRNKRNM